MLAAGFESEDHAGVEDIVAVVADVILPLLSTVRTGTAVVLPYTAAVTPEVVRVVAKLPVPLPVTSPVNVIVWSPVFVPETFAPCEILDDSIVPETIKFPIVPPSTSVKSVFVPSVILRVPVLAIEITGVVEEKERLPPIVSPPETLRLVDT